MPFALSREAVDVGKVLSEPSERHAAAVLAADVPFFWEPSTVRDRSMASGFDWKRSLHPVPLWQLGGALRRYSAPVGRSCGRRRASSGARAVLSPGASEEHLPALCSWEHGEC